jgi:hypothetical protein
MTFVKLSFSLVSVNVGEGHPDCPRPDDQVIDLDRPIPARPIVGHGDET